MVLKGRGVARNSWRGGQLTGGGGQIETFSCMDGIFARPPQKISPKNTYVSPSKNRGGHLPPPVPMAPPPMLTYVYIFSSIFNIQLHIQTLNTYRFILTQILLFSFITGGGTFTLFTPVRLTNFFTFFPDGGGDIHPCPPPLATPLLKG